MTHFASDTPAPVRLARLAALVAIADEPAIRAALADAHGAIPDLWVEEMILQSYLFAGFPRTLNAAREWRRISGRAAPTDDAFARRENADEWAAQGDVTCATVYGEFYERLRHNIRALHPALDEWMIVEGYGKVLSRPGLPLAVRELCIVAVCVAAKQDRQLHSHLHGALNAGASAEEVSQVLEAVRDLVTDDDAMRARMLWNRVRTSRQQPSPVS